MRPRYFHLAGTGRGITKQEWLDETEIKEDDNNFKKHAKKVLRAVYASDGSDFEFELLRAGGAALVEGERPRRCVMRVAYIYHERAEHDYKIHAPLCDYCAHKKFIREDPEILAVEEELRVAIKK